MDISIRLESQARSSFRCLIASCLLLAAAQSKLPADETFLGRSPKQWQEAFASATGNDRHHAAWAIATLSGQSPNSEAALVSLGTLVRDSDASVRYWGATGLSRLSQRSGLDHASRAAAIKALSPLLTDQAAAPRIAAAGAIGQLGEIEKSLPVLLAAMKDPQESARIQAAMVLESLGDRARLGEAVMREGTRDASEYVKRISERSLTRLAETKP
jgi:hypothetical protein